MLKKIAFVYHYNPEIAVLLLRMFVVVQVILAKGKQYIRCVSLTVTHASSLYAAVMSSDSGNSEAVSNVYFI